MLLKHRPRNKSLALAAVGVFLGLLGYFDDICSSTVDLHSHIHKAEGLPPVTENTFHNISPIPPEYGISCGGADKNIQPDTCLDTASAEYLRGLRRNAVEYCSSPSGDSVYSFHGTMNGLDRGTFYIAQGVVIDEVTRLFAFECGGWLTEKEPETDVCDLVQTKRQSGLGSVFDKYFHIRFKHKDIPEAPLEVEEHEAKPSNYTILIKREPTASFWDSLMEIMSMTLSVDVLRMSNDTRSGDSFIRIPAELPRTQAIVLDDLPDGPLYDLWSLFAGSAPIRLGGILEDKTRAHALLSAHTAIIPLPGNSNPLSQIDQYNVSDRRYSALVRTFSRRLLQKYGVMSSRGEIGIPKVVKVTLTSWPGTCEIRDIDHLLRALREAFPNVLVRAVDLAAMPMAA